MLHDELIGSMKIVVSECNKSSPIMPSELCESAAGPSQEFLDNNQYTLNGILRYEYIFGDNFISTGGLRTTEVYTMQDHGISSKYI